MAHYDAHGQRNRGYDGYGMKEAAYGAAVVGYSATTESYAASTEQVIKMGGYPYSNPGTHGQAWPRIQPKKGDDYDYDYDHNYSYSPKLSHGNASPHDSPRKGTLHRANSPRQGHHYSGMYGNNSPHDSPRKNFRSNFGSSGDDDSSEEEDVECRDGVCYPKPKHSGERKKTGNGYGAAGTNYPLTHSADRDRDHLHHQKSDPRKHYNSTQKLPEANHIYGNSHAKPATDAYFDRFSYPANNYTVPAPIKTRPDHHRDAKNSPKGAAAHWTPFGGSPRNEHQEMTTEAHNRRHGTTPPPQSDHKYKKTIDSETLAKMYGGVFVK